MSHQICFDLHHHHDPLNAHVRRRICIPLYYLIERFPPEDPRPPFEVPGIDPRVLTDLRILSTIAELAGRLSGDMSREIVGSVSASIEKLGQGLGDGVTLSRQAASM